MTRKKLRQIVCALQSLPSDIVGGLFTWTTSSLELFELIRSGRALDDADRMALDRALELAAGIARILHDEGQAARFEDYRAAFSRDITPDAREFLGHMLQATLLGRMRAREAAEVHYLRMEPPEDL